jgi:UDP-N-acetylmuramate: L-alanyl-gamma-D-glutamyl-meso-diaminopimelate ligase
VFQKEFARAFRAADETIVAAVFRSSLPDEDRLSPVELVADLEAAGQRARYIPGVDDIVTAVAADRREGDLVVVMSNGSFGGIHKKLLAALKE